MDASASKVDVENNELYGFLLNIQNTEFPRPIKQKTSVIKYTKLPEFDIESKASWPQKNYTLQPRLRRIVSVDESKSCNTRSLQSELVQPTVMVTNLTKRKIITITEDDEYDLHPKFSKDSRKASPVKTSCKSIGTDLKEPKQTSQHNTSRLSNSSKHLKETKASAKISTMHDENEHRPKPYYRNKQLTVNQVSVDNKSRKSRNRDVFIKESFRLSKSVNASKTSFSKNLVTPTESQREVTLIKTKLYDNFKPPKKHIEKPKASHPPAKTKTILKGLHRHKPVTVIHVPLDEKYRKCPGEALIYNPHTHQEQNVSANESELDLLKSNRSTLTEMLEHKDINISTDPTPETQDSVTEMNVFKPQLIYSVQSTDVQTELIKETFDSLEIPNVTLTKDNTIAKQESYTLHSQSLPNLQVPQFKFTSNRDELDTNYQKNTSYIISSATLTYTTKQKINVHVVGNNDDAYTNQSPSPLSYPINVVSVFKKEMQSAGSSNSTVVSDKEDGKSSKDYKNRINNIKSLDCSYIGNSDKLMKPSDIISTIRVNNGLLRSEYMSEQFQRELNFIDSFFESLRYLESSSLSEKCYKNESIDSFINHPEFFESELNVRSLEYDNLFHKLDNGANTEDTETMASKNLFLLNILIRDEQRRAKNLLFVLKRREDALKDFTKSQILYLENKKKQENTDISALKKKQRGALLKLQHECGEMQRMRKALLTLSERRKLTLMKTKKDLELKLKNNVDVDKILLVKKKVKRNASIDRTSPLKCFDLSSSGCEESSTSRRNSQEHVAKERVYAKSSAEKGIQTGDSIVIAPTAARLTTAAENFIIVDGGYLNILFHNLSLPQIFSGGKEYEVNEEALRHIVDSSNSRSNLSGGELETLMDQIKNRDTDRSSSPSTARSLVEEFDQYYKGLEDCDRSAEEDYRSSSTVCEVSDIAVQVESQVMDGRRYQSAAKMTCESSDTIVNSVSSLECACEVENAINGEGAVISPTGPLPVPAGAAAVVDAPVTDAPSWFPAKCSSSTTLTDSSTVSSQPPLCELVSSVSSLAAPAQLEAEELRRQQLAIEKEIKELEQQQCRMLVVREIPDKPPPPYTPPVEARVSKAPRKFQTDDSTEARILAFMSESEAEPCEATDSFDVFVHDFCREATTRHKKERSDRPWDACNLLPPKPEPDSVKLVKTISAELSEVLAGAKPTVVSGVSSRRSDHIDDILFDEWRRVEPEWTSLHTEESIVKNQIFESIFQRILTDTVDEYKRTVLCDPVCDSC